MEARSFSDCVGGELLVGLAVVDRLVARGVDCSTVGAFVTVKVDRILYLYIAGFA